MDTSCVAYYDGRQHHYVGHDKAARFSLQDNKTGGNAGMPFDFSAFSGMFQCRGHFHE